MSRIIQDTYTFDDVLLVPRKSTVLPKDVSLKTSLTETIQMNIPLLSAAMDTVTESRLAIAMAQEGGLGIIHKNMTIEAQASEVREVKKFESGVVKDPVTVSPEVTVSELIHLTQKHKFSGMPVIDDDNRIVGIVTSRDFRFETNMAEQVKNIMTPSDRLVTVLENTTQEEILALLHKHRIEKLLVTNDNMELKGLITVKDILKAKEKPSAAKDLSGQLRVGAAIGIGQDAEERFQALVAAGVDLIVIDTAHGHSENVMTFVKTCKQQAPQIPLMAGNVATPGAALYLVEAGADIIKVGIGPGSICTTRIVAGVGMPQLSAILNVAAVLEPLGVPLVADGGIRFSGDIAKAIAAGASAVMVGSLLAGTEESPGEIELYQGRTYKNYRGMGSLGAMDKANGSSDRYFQSGVNGNKLVPEGVEGRVPYKGSLHKIVHQLMGGLRSSMGYTGCQALDAMRTQTEFVRCSHASIHESHVHDVLVTKQAPNYQVEN